MNVACPECKSVFRVDPARVTSVNLRARCAVCGGLIAVGASIRWGEDFPAALGDVSRVSARASATMPEAPPPASPAAPAHVAPAHVAPAHVAPAQVAPVTETLPTSPVAASDPAVPSSPPAAPSWGGPSLGADGDAAAPTMDAAVPPRVPPFSPARRTAAVTPAFGAPAFPASSLRPPTPAFTPAFTPAAGAGPVRPSAPTPPAPTGELAPTPESAPPRLPSAAMPAPPVPAAPAAPAAPSAPSSALASPSASAAPAARRPINPFLSNDPNQKARRLARALVSDMVAYHPGKREDGHRNGTLKQLFRDEIKKSYEEYVEQVGRDFAESTTHFQDALNDVLAGGKRIF